jgi:leucyl aminopeptidase
MEEMKLDKTGAVVVNAVLKALAEMKAPVHVVAVTPLVENMVSATAQRPGDIVTSLSGQTIEVLNTDAEGRLILADALTYAQTMWKPKALVDVATLTGAVRVALGPVYAGVFSRHLGLRSQLEAAGESTGECLWPLPLHADYDKALDSACADMKNITASGFGAGSSTAAQFLARFVSKDVEWAHLDIAGVDVAHAASPLCPQGGSAFGVELLIRWVLSHHSHPAS